eukprot:CAMPEP_0174870358 /NCGR_PEP_ID=MMETSP1114-20130205/69584_1 /TAXON_ID=312471 /ORGANISM="Neobodo designis, Strain CCAP 1951/1" /LENGTH=39 /DNA_ID= /DNA_START= /DNA_END= /DNA_ORIENTATION=
MVLAELGRSAANTCASRASEAELGRDTQLPHASSTVRTR